MSFAKLAIVSLVIAVLAIALWRDEPLRLILSGGGDGTASTGKVLGVAIGDPRTSAKLALIERGLVQAGSQRGGVCVKERFTSAQLVDVYRDESWRKGVVCVASVNETVVRVEWYFNPLSP